MGPNRNASIRIVVSLLGVLLALPLSRAEEVLPAGVSPSWLSEAKATIERMEYHFSAQKDGFHAAPNRAHGLRTRVTEEGIEVESRTWGAAEGEGWQLTLRAVRFGRGSAFDTVRPGLSRFEEGRATLLREAFTELYVNDPRGLEQVFDVPVPPREHRDLGPLVIEMALGGNVLANLSEDGALVVFGSPAGKPVAHLRDLLVTDSTGASVPARFRLAPGSLAIEIDDLDAVYPLHVDPLLTTPAWNQDSDQASAGFGFSVATAGDVNGDGFSDVLIGIVQYDNGQTDEGRVSLYKGSASGLLTTPSKNFEQNQAFANFGWSVSTAGDVDGDGFDDFVVGAPNWDGAASNGGAIWVYRGSSTTPDDVADAMREGVQAAEHFGLAVAWAGDVDEDGKDDVIVGAPDYDVGPPIPFTDAGRVFLYFGDGSNVLDDSTDWEYSLGGQSSAHVGWSVATAGDVNGDGYDDVIVGAPDWDNSTLANAGMTLAFYGSSTGLPVGSSWSVSYGEANAHFGYSVSTAGDTNGDGYADVVIGAYLEDGAFTDEGAIFVYRGAAAGLDLGATHTRRSAEASGQLGWSVGTAGDVNGDGYADVIAGAPFVNAGGTDRGKAYVWCGSSGGIGASPCWTVDGTQNSAEFARSVATAGDVNGDGYSDVIVGAWKADNGSTDEGQAFVYLGSGDIPSATPAKKLQAANTSIAVNFGASVASAGDVNGDGLSDIIVGDPQNGSAEEGAAFIFLGTTGGPATTPSTTLGNDQLHDSFGRAVASAGDVNGDGYDDVVVGAPFWSVDPTGDQDENGRIYVYFGGSSGVDATADFEDTPTQLGVDANAGLFASPAGDLNGDGYGDFIVGGRESHGESFLYYGSATGPSDGNLDFVGGAQVAAAGDVNGDGFSDLFTMTQSPLGADAAGVFYGSASGIDNSPDWERVDDGVGGCPAGDVNGDGYADVVIEEGHPGVTLDELFLGGPSGLPATASQVLPFGFFNCRAAGDVNGDGRADLLVRAGTTETVNLFLGSSTGLSTTAVPFATDTPGNAFGDSFARAGDVNGDGFDDFLVGAPNESPGGRVDLFYGGGGDGLDRLPRQGRVSTTAPVALLGSSDSTQVKLKVMLRTPAGRGRVGYRYETALEGGAFGSGPSATIDPSLTVAPGTSGSRLDASQSLSGLAPESWYKWRARFLTTNPFFPRSRWLSVPGNGIAETDFRTPCTATTWFRDFDLDGFGNAALTQSSCTQPAGYVAVPGDCNDSDATMFPGNPEVCDGKDNNCAGGIDDGFVAPTVRPAEVASKSGTTITVSWPLVPGADSYDVVKGDLARLRSTGGDFASATTTCLSDGNGHPVATDTASPAAGNGFWYLVRANNCNAAGSYDDGTSHQIGSRDSEIKASGAACP